MTKERRPTQEECMSAAIKEYVRAWYDQYPVVGPEEAR